ncbi:hypothetical protein [Mumia zhuanghuii]|uniref:Uncharacterized protein n=1 Tax=Mumia zhuanghuii TaxID=2585211 RepID=A0A5C4LTS0_9ACTN|nr:hypothetical protein [Mumia zhuanghuii]TNC22042.1 hypothetical protein FHE65_36215 [Mumia zhuanghuii]TNC22181.1 hypothetical protein FHE65_35880 [Mumia zhuanghuii]
MAGVGTLGRRERREGLDDALVVAMKLACPPRVRRPNKAGLPCRQHQALLQPAVLRQLFRQPVCDELPSEDLRSSLPNRDTCSPAQPKL